MTDIFLRIAERALGLAPTIQPMVAPLYAPSAYDEPFEAATEQEASRDSSHTDDFRVTSDMAIGNANAVSNAPVSRNTDIAGIPPVANQVHLSPLERNTPTSLQAEKEKQQTQLTHWPKQANLSQAANATYTNMVEPVTVTHGNEHSTFSPIIRQEHNQVEQQISPASPVHLSEIHATPIAQRATLQTKQSQVENVQRLQRRPLQHDEQEKKADTSGPRYKDETRRGIEQSAPTVPTVHVTIGRIEVRANSVPNMQAPAQRQSTAPKTMSLAEYLQQNGKGGRS